MTEGGVPNLTPEARMAHVESLSQKNPLEIFKIVENARRNDKIPDFLIGVEALSRTAAINTPSVVNHLRKLGDVEEIWIGAYKRLQSVDQRGNQQEVTGAIRVAELLGLEEVPKVAGELSALRQKLGEREEPLTELARRERAFMQKREVAEEDIARQKLQADLDSIRNHGGMAGWVTADYRQGFEQMHPGEIPPELSSAKINELVNARITKRLPEDMVAAQIAPPGNDPLSPWVKLAEIVPPEDVARIEFAVFCRMQDGSMPDAWEQFFNDPVSRLRTQLRAAGRDINLQQKAFEEYEPRIAVSLDQENRELYARLLELRAKSPDGDRLPQKTKADQEADKADFAYEKSVSQTKLIPQWALEAIFRNKTQRAIEYYELLDSL